MPQLRGPWLDRLSGIDRDIAALTAKLEGAKPGESPARADAAIKEVLAPARREVPACEHTPPVRFVPGQPQELMIETKAASVTLYYRHVNQAERFTGVAMQQLGDRHRATIPAVYNDSFYPLEYYFEVRAPGGKSNLYPGFSKNLTNQPYFVVRRG